MMNDTIQENKLKSFLENLSPTALKFSKEYLDIAKETLSTVDFPTTRNEAWKYTRVGRIASIKVDNRIPLTDTLSESILIAKDAFTFVFENGILNQQLLSREIPSGLTIKPISACTEQELSIVGRHLKLENEVFNSINTAYATDGLYIHIADKLKLDLPIQIIHQISGNQSISNTRNFIQCGKFSEVQLIQVYNSVDANSSFSNIITEAIVDENAHLTIDKIQNEAEGNYHVATEQVVQEKNSTFTINTVTLNGTLVRNNLNIEVNGTNCISNLNGAYILKDNQHVDNHTIVDHRAPHCESHELYKGVIDDKATAVFNGKVFVRKDSQKINAFQSNGNVLLSDTATVNSKPELEIYADDVKCSHGSTTGQLNEEAVFYLRARGISEKSARHLMVSAFINDVLEKIENQDVLDYTHSILSERFGWEF